MPGWFFFFLVRYPAVYGRLLEPPVGANLKTWKLPALRVLIDSDGLHPQVFGHFLNREDSVFWHEAPPLMFGISYTILV